MVKWFIVCGTMTIEKTYKLIIKDTTFNLTEDEVHSLYETCRKALNVSITNPNWPTYPYWPTYPWTGGTGEYIPNWQHSTITCSTSARGTGTTSGSNCFISSTTPSTGINFLSDDMETIKDNNKWRTSLQQTLDKLNVKTNVTTTSEGIKVG